MKKKKDILTVKVGKDRYIVNPTSDGRGIRLENKADSIFIPYEEGTKVMKALSEKIGNETKN